MVLTQDKNTGQLIMPPEMISSGFIDVEEHGETVSETAHLVMEALGNGAGQPLERDVIATKVKDTVGNFLHRQTGRRPMIVPVVVQV